MSEHKHDLSSSAAARMVHQASNLRITADNTCCEMRQIYSYPAGLPCMRLPSHLSIVHECQATQACPNVVQSSDAAARSYGALHTECSRSPLIHLAPTASLPISFACCAPSRTCCAASPAASLAPSATSPAAPMAASVDFSILPSASDATCEQQRACQRFLTVAQTMDLCVETHSTFSELFEERERRQLPASK